VAVLVEGEDGGDEVGDGEGKLLDGVGVVVWGWGWGDVAFRPEAGKE
jgi:hypothetical protein